ncbi:mRNA cap guanine-N7 methyltransferase [Sporothrix epigloea]|uniref:mRNA cap guanine-N(7) methyltransferase n=1 Tax=Sporothrix epigloea TaxID=1892477 RepID=A0ABP0DHA3_9PEZI
MGNFENGSRRGETYSEQKNNSRRSQSPDNRRDDRSRNYRDDRRGNDRDDRRDNDRDDRHPKRRLQSYASRRNDQDGDRRDDRDRRDNRNDYDRRANDELPQPFDARVLEPAKKRVRSRSPTGEPVGAGGPSASTNSNSVDLQRKPKRPGQRARITDAERAAIRQRALDRERHIKEEQEREEKRAAISDVVRSHYNAVPERGREWRKTASTIKGLRSMNNWVKSCIIQKFAPDEEFEERTRNGIGGAGHQQLLVLDIGCGKGGDLGKWNSAPQQVQLYVGLDPADVSIDQARDRYREMTSRAAGRGGYHNRAPPRAIDARFFVKDCFGESIGDINIIQDVGFDQNPLSRKGFDVVSMMFCMHYAFETEQRARTMLKNVASALKKGGRLIGCIPNSDVLSDQVERFHIQQAEKEKKRLEEAAARSGEQTNSETPAEAQTENGTETKPEPVKESVEWGNSIYRVRFPGDTPADGVFRPPFGWKYSFFLNEAVEEVPEYVVPWHAFRALAEDYNLELQYHKTFPEVWEAEKDDRILGPLSDRMGVRDRNTGELLVSKEEMEAASFYVAFCFYKV